MPPENVRHILAKNRKVAVVGISPHPDRPSHWIARYLMDQGFEVTGVNPALPQIDAIPLVANIGEVPGPLQIVNVFRSSEHVPALIEELISLRPRVVWLQEGAEHPEAEARARAAGIEVVSGRCIYRDHRAL